MCSFQTIFYTLQSFFCLCACSARSTMSWLAISLDISDPASSASFQSLRFFQSTHLDTCLSISPPFFNLTERPRRPVNRATRSLRSPDTKKPPVLFGGLVLYLSCLLFHYTTKPPPLRRVIIVW